MHTLRRRSFLGGALATPACLATATPNGGPKSLRIRRVRLYVVNVPETKWWWSDDVFGQPEHQRMDHKLVEVETEQGLTGLTEINYTTPEAEALSQLGKWVRQDILTLNLTANNLPFPMAAEQMALDLRGQALGVPVYQLLGGLSQERVRVAHSLGIMDVGEARSEAQSGR